MTTSREHRLQRIARDVPPKQEELSPEAEQFLESLTIRQLKWLNAEANRLDREVAAGQLDPSRKQEEFNKSAFVAGIRSDMERRGELADPWPGLKPAVD